MLYWSYTRHCNENPGQNEENEDLGERQLLRGILVHEVMEEILRENIGSNNAANKYANILEASKNLYACA